MGYTLEQFCSDASAAMKADPGDGTHGQRAGHDPEQYSQPPSCFSFTGSLERSPSPRQNHVQRCRRPLSYLNLRREGLGFQPARVSWVEDGRVGIELEQMLHEAVLARLKDSLAGAA